MIDPVENEGGEEEGPVVPGELEEVYRGGHVLVHHAWDHAHQRDQDVRQQACDGPYTEPAGHHLGRGRGLVRQLCKTVFPDKEEGVTDGDDHQEPLHDEVGEEEERGAVVGVGRVVDGTPAVARRVLNVHADPGEDGSEEGDETQGPDEGYQGS